MYPRLLEERLKSSGIRKILVHVSEADSDSSNSGMLSEKVFLAMQLYARKKYWVYLKNYFSCTWALWKLNVRRIY